MRRTPDPERLKEKLAAGFAVNESHEKGASIMKHDHSGYDIHHGHSDPTRPFPAWPDTHPTP